MKRNYSTGIKYTPIFFTGKEVEHTPAYGLKTLFVVDKQDATEIVEYARGYECSHVYLGANHSFNGVDLKKWQKMIDTINSTKIAEPNERCKNCAYARQRSKTDKIG